MSAHTVWRRFRSGMLVPMLLLALGCAGSQPWSLQTPPTEADDRRPLAAEPEESDISLYWDAVHQTSFYLFKRSLDLPRQHRRLTGQPKQARNPDVFGEVPNSTWFTNRHGRVRMTADELRRGPNTMVGPDFSAPWTIVRAKTMGVTPGFFVTDGQGETFILKFDPPGHPELVTGAEIISTKFFHACGYNVPENYLITFDPATLTIKEGLEYRDRNGNKEPFTQAVLASVLGRVEQQPDGLIRAVASRFLPGKPIGAFSYQRTRDDDANDRIPHQHRRELRGLKVFAQLVNHYDTKDLNTLDIIADDGDGPYVRHYLIDFGSTLGADGDAPKPVYKGYAYVIDLEQALVSLVTLGLRRWSWEGASADGMPPSVGYFESERFHPPEWKPLHANQAFDNLTDEDAYWATRILAEFTADDLRACVETAEFSDPEAIEYLVTRLLERRRKIIAYYYSKLNPLDDFVLRAEDGSLQLNFTDRWVADGVGTADQVEHRYRFGHQKKSWGGYRSLEGGGPVIVDAETMARIAAMNTSATQPDDHVYSVQIQSRRQGHWGHAVQVFFYYDGDQSTARLVGVRRDS